MARRTCHCLPRLFAARPGQCRRTCLRAAGTSGGGDHLSPGRVRRPLGTRLAHDGVGTVETSARRRRPDSSGGSAPRSGRLAAFADRICRADVHADVAARRGGERPDPRYGVLATWRSLGESRGLRARVPRVPRPRDAMLPQVHRRRPARARRPARQPPPRRLPPRRRRSRRGRGSCASRCAPGPGRRRRARASRRPPWCAGAEARPHSNRSSQPRRRTSRPAALRGAGSRSARAPPPRHVRWRRTRSWTGHGPRRATTRRSASHASPAHAGRHW